MKRVFFKFQTGSTLLNYKGAANGYTCPHRDFYDAEK